MDRAALKKMTVAELREQAKEIPDAKGISSMKKDDLIELIASHAGTGQGATNGGPSSVAPATDKSEIKRRIRELKAQKQDALSQQDRKLAKACNRQIRHYKRALRKLARAGTS